jgi:hypothetical protein
MKAGVQYCSLASICLEFSRSAVSGSRGERLIESMAASPKLPYGRMRKTGTGQLPPTFASVVSLHILQVAADLFRAAEIDRWQMLGLCRRPRIYSRFMARCCCWIEAERLRSPPVQEKVTYVFGPLTGGLNFKLGCCLAPRCLACRARKITPPGNFGHCPF